MSEFLFHYEKVAPTTWAYLSSLLMIGLFFKFSRFWSVRNLDLILLILLAPGLLLYHYGLEARNRGQILVDQERIEAEEQAEKGADDPEHTADAGGAAKDDGQTRGASIASAGQDTTEEDGSESEASDALITESETGKVDSSTEQSPDPAVAATSKTAETETAPQTPGQELRETGNSTMRMGFVWLFCVTGLLLLRMLIDPTMVRRPLLEPNLSTGGLAFIGCSLFVFLMANVISSVPTEVDLQGPKSAEQLLSGENGQAEGKTPRWHGPGYALLNLIPSIPTMPLLHQDKESKESKQHAYATAAKTMAILAHLATVIGIVGVGYWHFDNMKMGIGAATMYLMLPYTAQMTGRIDHVLPASLLVWAILCYRRPLTTGLFLGTAIGVVYYPIFLLPLWCSFYWQRGLMRFALGIAIMLTIMVISLLFVPTDLTFLEKFRQMFGLRSPEMENLGGVWALGWYAAYRIPVLAAFGALSGVLALWPAQKNLGTLLSCSGAVMMATQFWHGYGGGLYMAWYLPLLLLTIFRPNLEDRVALSVLGEGWFPRRRLNFGTMEKEKAA